MTDLVTDLDAGWWKSAVVYQVYPRSFADSNGDGMGDIRGVIEHLDYLQTLGVDVVWLSTVYRSPQDDNGYDISDYYDIDPVFGTLGDIDALIAGLHERGMRLLMDLVVNHTSDEHPWFLESASGIDSSKREWYVWRPPRAGFVGGEPGAEPNNWVSFFSGSAWQYDASSGEYYLHLFSRKQPDLNWDNPAVRRAVAEMMRWWLARGVDGFRMDVINFLSKADGLPDGEPIPGSRFGDGSPFYQSGPHIHEYLQEMHREVFGDNGDRYLTVGEMPGSTIEQARLYSAPERRELDMIFQFEHVGLDHTSDKFERIPLDVRALKKSLFDWQLGLADSGWNSLYWNNHDQPRVVSRFGDDGVFRVASAKALALVLHLMRGTPYVYQGEELGMTNTSFRSIHDFLDIEARNYYTEHVENGESDAGDVLDALRVGARDNARTPMQWTADANAGFTSGTPWMPVNANHVGINAAAELDDPASVFSFYRRVIALRHLEPAVAYGTFEPVLADDPVLFAYRRAYEGTTLTVLVNFGSVAHTVDASDLAELASDSLVLSNLGETDGASFVLRPWEARLYRGDAA